MRIPITQSELNNTKQAVPAPKPMPATPMRTSKNTITDVSTPKQSHAIQVCTPRKISITVIPTTKTIKTKATTPKGYRQQSPSLTPTQIDNTPSTLVSDLIKPVETPQTSAFFAEHNRIEEGLSKARAHDPTPTPFPKSPAHEVPKAEPTACDNLLSQWKNDSKPSPKDAIKHASLVEYNQKYRGLNTAHSEPLHGKSTTYSGFSHLYNSLRDVVVSPIKDPPKWRLGLPTRASLHSIKRFGRPSKDHSSTQEGCLETCLFTIITSGFLDFYSFCCLCNTHLLVIHLITMIIKCHSYDFSWIAYEDPFWK